MSSCASLNHIYRTVWNQALGTMVAVAEIASTGGCSMSSVGQRRDRRPGYAVRLSTLAIGIASAWLAGPATVLANPTGGTAIVGQASMVNQGNRLTVTTQNGALGNYSAINWQSFSIPAGSTTYFQQPSASSTSINRVVTNNPSQIFGTLGSNGNLVLVNQSGITVGAGAVVDSAGFAASSLRMSDADAMAGRMRFGDGNAGGAGVSVQGSILARSGDVVLLGSQVDTGKDALIQSPNGSTLLAAGRQIEITGRGLEGISLQVQAPVDSALNLGTLQGDAVGIFAGTLRHSGLIQATTASMEGGKVILKAGGDAYLDGAGRILATGTRGGAVDVLGKRVAVLDQALIDVSGEQGGGTVRVGGDYQGKNPDVLNADISFFGPQASIKADSTVSGDGGKVIVWADDTTRTYGRISAQGGQVGGNGGFVETSGHRYLDFQGNVNTLAAHGVAGSLLLDPSDITILNLPNGSSPGMSTATPFFSSNSPSSLATSDLISALSQGNVVVDASAGGYGGAVGNITVASPVGWTNASSLTLQSGSGGSIVINSSIAAGGALKLNAGLDLTIGVSGSIASAASGDAVVMLANGTFNGYGGSISFSNGGRWLAYLKDPGNHVFPATPSFKQYNAAFGATVLGTGNGVLYNNTTPAVLTATGQTGPADALTGLVSKVYDGGLAISLAGAGYSTISGGLVDGDALSVAVASGGVSGGVGSLSDPNVGTGKQVTASNVNVTGLLGGNGISTVYGYQVRGNIGEVTPAHVISSISLSGSRVYDGTNIVNANIFSLSGLVAGETLTLSGSGTVADKNVGLNKPVSLGSLALGDGSGLASNYTFSGGTQVASITPAFISGVSGLTAVSKVYDGTTVAAVTGGTLLGALPGDSVALGLGSASFNDKNVGKAKPVAVTGLTLIGADAANYTLGSSSASVSADITPKALSVSAVTAANKVYDGSNVATVSGGVLSGAITGDAVSLGVLSGAFSDKNAGLGKTVNITGLSLSGADALNYTLGSTTASTTADISQAAISSVGRITASSKVYDGNTSATLNTASASFAGAISGDSLSVATATGVFSDKNAGLGKAVNITGLSLSGADALNYTLGSTTASTTADISRAVITGVSGIVVNDKVYDGKTTATVVTSGVNFAGLIAGDHVTVGSLDSAFIDRNVGRGKAVNLSNLTLSGPDSVNYTVTGIFAPATGNITVRPLSTWIAAGSGQWSWAANWDALPDASNVLAVAIPTGVTVAYDAAVGVTQLQSISGNFTMAGGNLSIASGLSASQYGQTGGAFSLGAGLSVNGSFSQSGGTIAASGPVSISQNSGNLTVAAINAPAISLSAPAGSISQSAALVTSGLLSTRSQGSTLLNDAGNRIGSFSASSTGVGDIEQTSVGAIDVQGINAAAGNVTLFNTGGISTSGPVIANGGAVRMTANSPLTVGMGGISATGNIDLLASNLTSAGNLTLNGDLVSSAGAITLTAANDFAQYGSVSAALGLTVSAGGSVFLGPLARSFGNPVNYGVGGLSVATPPGSQSTTGSAPNDFVATFLSLFERAIVAASVFGVDPLLPTGTDRRGITVEGDLCAR